MGVLIIAWVTLVGVAILGVLSKIVVMQTKHNQVLEKICDKLEGRNDD